MISDLFETGENDERFLLAGIADVLQLSESDGLRKLERKRRDAGDNRQQDMAYAGYGLWLQKRRQGAVRLQLRKMMAGPDSQAATASGRTQQGCSSEAAKLPDLCRDRRTATADSRCRGRAVCSVTTGI